MYFHLIEREEESASVTDHEDEDDSGQDDGQAVLWRVAAGSTKTYGSLI